MVKAAWSPSLWVQGINRCGAVQCASLPASLPASQPASLPASLPLLCSQQRYCCTESHTDYMQHALFISGGLSHLRSKPFPTPLQYNSTHSPTTPSSPAMHGICCRCAVKQMCGAMASYRYPLHTWMGQ